MRIGSAAWRPFEGPLGPRARRQALVILGGLYRFLQDQKWVPGNPWSGVGMPRNSEPRIGTGRSFSHSQWQAIEREVHEGARDFARRQLAWAVRLLHATGLRLSEVVAADCGDLRWADIEDEPVEWPAGAEKGAVHGSWILRVIGKGLKIRDVPVPASLVDALAHVLVLGGCPGDPRLCPDRPLLLRSKASGRPMARLSRQALYRQLKRLFGSAAERIAGEGRPLDAQTFRRASTHWLRHTHGTHSAARGVPLDVVRENMGHSSLATTGIYLKPSLARRVRETSRLTTWGAG